MEIYLKRSKIFLLLNKNSRTLAPPLHSLPMTPKWIGESPYFMVFSLFARIKQKKASPLFLPIL